MRVSRIALLMAFGSIGQSFAAFSLPGLTDCSKMLKTSRALDAIELARLETLLEYQFHRDMLTVLDGIKPASWTSWPVVAEPLFPQFTTAYGYRLIARAIETGVLTQPNIGWVYVQLNWRDGNRHGDPSDASARFGLYPLHVQVLSERLKRKDVIQTFQKFGIRVPKNLAESVELLESSKRLYLHMDTRDTDWPESRKPWDVVMGVYFGYRLADVVRWSQGETGHRSFSYYSQPSQPKGWEDLYLPGHYATWAHGPTAEQKAAQERTRTAVGKYKTARRKGLSAIEIYNHWNELSASH